MTSARRKNERRCPICGRASAGELCWFHEEGAKRLASHYEVWRARTSVSWAEYLGLVFENGLSGEWARESARYLLGKAVRGQTAPTA